MGLTDSLQLLVDLDASGLERQINSTVTKISGAFGKFKDIDLSKMLSKMDSINWTSLVGKLFAPANLIAFFSAMAATGIIQSIQQQQQIATTAGATGETIPQATQASAEAVQTFRQLGTQAGSLTSIQSSINTFTALTGSITDAQKITQALGKAAEATGTQIQNVLPNLVTFLQNAGIKSTPQIITVIDNLLQATQASGGLETMGQIAQQLESFGTAAQAANAPLSSVSQEIVAFGSSIKNLGVSKATANLDLLNNSLEGTQAGLIASRKSKQEFDKLFATKGPVTAMTEIDTTVKNLTPNMNGLLASSLGLSEAAITGATSFLLVKDAIKQAADTANTSMTPAIQNINHNWQRTDTITREVGKRMADLETLFMDANTQVGNLTTKFTTIAQAPGTATLLQDLQALALNPNSGFTFANPKITSTGTGNVDPLPIELNINFKNAPAGLTASSNPSSNINMLINGLPGNYGTPGSNKTVAK